MVFVFCSKFYGDFTLEVATSVRGGNLVIETFFGSVDEETHNVLVFVGNPGRSFAWRKRTRQFNSFIIFQVMTSFILLCRMLCRL